MKTIKFISILIFSLISSSVCSQSKYQEWRGENRSGIYQETNLLKSWPENGPDLIWEFDQLGYGYGTPLVTNNRIYALGEIDSIGHLFALDLSGKLIWKKEYGIEWTKSFRGSRSTPTLVEDLLYVCSGFGDISCFNAKTGDLKWTKSLEKDFDGRNALHGHSESLLVDKEKLFLFAGGIENNIVALNRFNGEIIWKNKGIGETSAYNSP
ncbi:MAG: PQQ-binding-like beta-propeller repeat protein, partial [Bacteroidota bacterium]